MECITLLKDKLNHPNIGGKAKNLAILEQLKLPIPPWIVIPANVLLDQIKNTQLSKSKLTVPSEVFSSSQHFFGNHYRSKSYAVRSSGMEEDGVDFSFAGQFETFLHVPFEELEGKIIACWTSSQSERIKAYRTKNKLNDHQGIAVIIQEMVDAEISGVAFGINPTTGIPNSKIINSVYGLGEGLVSGELDGDTFSIIGEKIESQLAQKTHKYIQNKEKSGIIKIEVESQEVNASSLTTSQISTICNLLDTLKTEFKTPQDIEFSFKNDTLYLLQTRPITAIANQEKGEYTVWDNSNIVESYPGITTPLTFSFIIKMYEMVYTQFVKIMGVDKKTIEEHAQVFAQTLGLVRGRVYYNLLNWYKMLAMVPGYSINAENMERMMGVKERFELTEELTMSKSKARWRTLIMVSKMIYLQVKLPRERKKFQQYLTQILKSYEQIELNTKTPQEIIKLYTDFESNLLLKWKAPLINDFFAMIWFGLLEKQTQKYFPESPSLHNNLLCASQDIISVEPIHKTIEICELIRQDNVALKLFSSKSREEIWKELSAPNFSAIFLLIKQYISKFGNRCIGELKLETISYSQQPELFIEIIQTYINQGIDRKSISSSLEEELRKEATGKVNIRFRRNPIKKIWFNFCLKKTRNLVSNRENLRYERTRGFGMVRKLFSALGEKWYLEGSLEHPRDIFYLELNEIKQQVNFPFNPSLKNLIKERKRTFDEYQQQLPPMERFFTFGNDFSDEFIYSKDKTEGPEENLKGIGCCPGKVTGTVRIVKNPSEISSLNGDILVTSSTDPGWVTLFPSASAILVERGSLLSHSAIVSREMGIPCIVGITGLMRTLKTGDKVEMNGSTGIITTIEN